MKVRDEEIFGSVVTVEPYEHFSRCGCRGERFPLRIKSWLADAGCGKHTGSVPSAGSGPLIVDGAPTWWLDSMPYGGVKDSGEGREGVRYAIDEMTEKHLLAMAL